MIQHARTPMEWLRVLSPMITWEVCYPVVHNAAQISLDGLPLNVEISTVQLLNALCPVRDVAPEQVKYVQAARHRMYKALTVQPPRPIPMPMAGYCTQGAATKNHFGKMARHWFWHAFRVD